MEPFSLFFRYQEVYAKLKPVYYLQKVKMQKQLSSKTYGAYGVIGIIPTKVNMKKGASISSERSVGCILKYWDSVMKVDINKNQELKAGNWKGPLKDFSGSGVKKDQKSAR